MDGTQSDTDLVTLPDGSTATDRQTDRRTDGRTDARTDARTHAQALLCSIVTL